VILRQFSPQALILHDLLWIAAFPRNYSPHGLIAAITLWLPLWVALPQPRQVLLTGLGQGVVVGAIGSFVPVLRIENTKWSQIAASPV